MVYQPATRDRDQAIAQALGGLARKARAAKGQPPEAMPPLIFTTSGPCVARWLRQLRTVSLQIVADELVEQRLLRMSLDRLVLVSTMMAHLEAPAARWAPGKECQGSFQIRGESWRN